MTHDQALRRAKKLWGERATVDLNPLYELCCAVGVMSVPEPGDHSRFNVKGLAREWETCFNVAELQDAYERQHCNPKAPPVAKAKPISQVTCQKCYLSQNDRGQKRCIECDAPLWRSTPMPVSQARQSTATTGTLSGAT